MPTIAGGTAASEWQVGSALNRAQASGVSVLTTGSVVVPVEISPSAAELTVNAELTGAANGDLAVTVNPILPSGAVSGVTLTALRSQGPTFGSGVVDYTGVYDVSGYTRVQVTLKNNNAGTQTLQYTIKVANTT